MDMSRIGNELGFFEPQRLQSLFGRAIVQSEGAPALSGLGMAHLTEGIVERAYANRQLGNAWEGLSLFGGGPIHDRVVQGEGQAQAQRALPYPRGASDNVENRELKAEYSGARAMIENIAPDPGRYDTSTKELKDGLWTVREESADGSWREFSYSDDRSTVVSKDSTGREYSKDGDTIRYKNAGSGAEWAFAVTDGGDLFKVQKDSQGGVKTKVADADGSYKEMNVRGEVTKKVDANADMAKFEALAAKMGSSIGPDGKAAPLAGDQKYLLAAALCRFDTKTLDNLSRSGVTIRLVDENNPPPGGYPGGRDTWVEGGQGYYTLKDKAVVLKQSDFTAGGNIIVVDTIHHEIAHAVDDMLAPDTASRVNDSTEKDAAFTALYNDYRQRVESDPSAAWSRYASTNAQEYFAEGVMKYLGGDSAKAMLLDADPGLFSYIEGMLAKSTDPGLPARQREAPQQQAAARAPFWVNPFFSGGGLFVQGASNPIFPTFPGPWNTPQGVDQTAVLNNFMSMRAMQMQQMRTSMFPMMGMMSNPFLGLGMIGGLRFW